MTSAHRPRMTGFFAGLSLWGVWAMTALPFFALFFEFRCGRLGECGQEWWYYARLYSHFFIYPITFGLISTIFLHRPWIRTIHYLGSLPGHTRAMTSGLIAVSMLAVVVFMGHVEFSGSHSSSAFKNCEHLSTEHERLAEFSGATPAPWSIAPEAMEAREEGPRVHALLEAQCRRAQSGEVRGLGEEEKCEFQQKLNSLWKDGDGPRSHTEDYYRAGFLAMIVLFAFLFVTIFIAGIQYSKNGKTAEARKNPEAGSMMRLLALALVFATFWVLMRITFLTEKLSIYPEDPFLIYNWFIFLIFVVIYVYMIIELRAESGRYENYLNLALSIASLVITVIGVVNEALSVEWIPEALVDVFGTGSTPLTYIALLLFLLVVHFPHLLRLAEKWGSDHEA